MKVKEIYLRKTLIMTPSKSVITVQKIEVFRRKRLRIRSHLLKKSLMENFSLCAVDLSGNLHPYCYKENISPSNVEIIWAEYKDWSVCERCKTE